jgi:hypothetical protein
MSKNILKRWQDHRTKSMNPCKKEDKDKVLYKAIRKYGLENFTIDILEEIPANDIDYMKQREIYWIKEKDTYYHGYNETKGGDFVGENQAHFGENHALHVFTLEEVKKCRQWYKEGYSSKEIYDKYFSHLKWSGFINMWHGRNWKYVMPEVFSENPRPRRKVTHELAQEIIKRYEEREENESLNHIYQNNFKDKISWATFYDTVTGKRNSDV